MEKFNFDIITRTLTITSKFAEQMTNPDSREYNILIKFKSDFPDLKIVKRTHKTPTSYTTNSGEKCKCNPNKNLSYDRMEKFINALPQNEDYLREYDIIKNKVSSVQTNGYALVRKWFVAQFPLYRQNPMFYFNNNPKVILANEVLNSEAA